MNYFSSSSGLAQFEQCLTRNILHCVDKQTSHPLPCHINTSQLLDELLHSDSYEIRWETLEYLRKFSTYRPLIEDSDCNEEDDQPSRCVAVYL